MERLLSVDAAAKKMGVSRYAVYRWCQRKEFPHLKLGHKVLIAASVVDSWVENQMKQNASVPAETNAA
jgi:excisionase family DNA binding protein